MAILLHPDNQVDDWHRAFTGLLPSDELRLYPEIGDPDSIEFVVAWVMPRADLAKLSNLRAIFSTGAGTEQWQKPGMPDVPVVRLADPAMANEMASYALAYVVPHHRGFDRFAVQQAESRWDRPDSHNTARYRVGILGYGTIGARIGAVFRSLGYSVNAWSRSGRDEPGVESFAGPEQLDDFLGQSDAVINVLPNTDATSGLLTRDRLGSFAPGSIFVNIGRGSVLESEDVLIAALGEGPLAAAVLDVTAPEPPLGESRLWHHPAVTLTPHISGITQLDSAASIIAANIAKFRSGQAVSPLLDRERGY